MNRALLVGEWIHVARCSRALVSPGESVGADARVGIDVSRGQVLLVDVAAPLGLEPAQVLTAMAVGVGDAVKRGQPLAALKGRLRRRAVLAPSDGVVQGVAAGCVLLRQPGSERPVMAGLAGTVAAVSAGEVALSCHGTRVAGAWGCGGVGQGALTIANEAADGELTWQQVGRHLVGAVLVGGWLREERAIMRARQFGVGGLLVGGLAAPLMRQDGWGLPIVVTEGMGVQHMAPSIHAALRRLAGCVALLRGGGAEGEAYAGIVHPLDEETPPSVAVGARVRLTRRPHLGREGQIVDLPGGVQRTALGTLAPGALVALRSGQRLFVPWENLDLLS